MRPQQGDIFALVAVALVLTVLVSALTDLSPLDDVLGLPAYEIDFYGEPVYAADVASTPSDQLFTTPNGVRLYCPLAGTTNVEAPRERRPIETRTPSQIVRAGLKLLAPLAKQPCLSVRPGWWQYDYCHSKHVLQSHDSSGDNVRLEYVLGTADVADDPMIKVSGGKRILSVRFRNGTICLETERPRTVEVQFQCAKDGIERLVGVSELALCSYQAVVHTPRLCADPAFADLGGRAATKITCRRIIQDGQEVPPHPLVGGALSSAAFRPTIVDEDIGDAVTAETKSSDGLGNVFVDVLAEAAQKLLAKLQARNKPANPAGLHAVNRDGAAAAPARNLQQAGEHEGAAAIAGAALGNGRPRLTPETLQRLAELNNAAGGEEAGRYQMYLVTDTGEIVRVPQGSDSGTEDREATNEMENAAPPNGARQPLNAESAEARILEEMLRGSQGEQRGKEEEEGLEPEEPPVPVAILEI